MVHLYWPPSSRLSGLKERVAPLRNSIMKLGVSLSHLILVAVTASDSSPVRSHVREYVCPSLGGPLFVKTSVNGGAKFEKQYLVV